MPATDREAAPSYDEMSWIAGLAAESGGVDQDPTEYLGIQS
jgi:hypothetical protein